MMADPTCYPVRRVYNRDIKGRYDCRLGGVPEY